MDGSFGERLRALRVARAGSQEALARAAGVSRGAVQGWEAGRRLPRIDAAAALADALGVTLDELAGRGEGPRASAPPGGADVDATIVAALRAAGEPVREAVLYERVLSRGADVGADEFLDHIERLSTLGHLRVSVDHDDRRADPEPFEPRMWRVVR